MHLIYIAIGLILTLYLFFNPLRDPEKLRMEEPMDDDVVEAALIILDEDDE